MTTSSQGDVVLVPFPFTDLSTQKRRPAVVISADWFNQSRNDCVLVAVTSQIPNKLDKDQLLLSPSDLTSAGLPKPSIIKLGKIITINQTLIVKTLGKLSTTTLSDVLMGVQHILS
jgi:mRNA interferase MazF